MNSRFIKKIPPGSEVVNLLTGEIDELDRRVAAFIRLKVSFARIRVGIPSCLRCERIRQPFVCLEVSFLMIGCVKSSD